ncbi:Alpha/Beta hydrolase protein [Aspergillus pseudoustus]|uniref:Alpha/Beta hydrolase protein n=1 Tax=Aspergillus pseudoustus TaxID=1810923 RepID=A0ABR4JDC6_9EURO
MKVFTSGIAALGMAVSAYAQNLSYGADNFYRSPNVTVHPITFPTQNNNTIAGNLFTRNNLPLNGNASAPAIVVGHPMGAVKEQSANLYATRLAEQGFITVSLDLPSYGGSSGFPINSVSPELYAEAFSAAVDYLGTQDFVNRTRIGVLGVCGSGGFVVSAAKIDPRIRAIASVSMYDMGAVNRNGLRHSQNITQRQQVIAAAAQQRWNEVDGAGTLYVRGTPLNLTANPVDREFFDFYRTRRGAFVPENSTFELTTARSETSNVRFLNFYPFNDIETISPRPLLFVSGDQAHSREFSEDAYRRAAEPKELYWVPGAGHVDLYDRVELIPWERFYGFFRANL